MLQHISMQCMIFPQRFEFQFGIVDKDNIDSVFSLFNMFNERLLQSRLATTSDTSDNLDVG